MRIRAAAFLVLTAAFGCLPSKQDVETAQSLIEIGDALNDIRQQQSVLQEQVDSLRFEMSRRDTVIKQLANLAGVVIPP